MARYFLSDCPKCKSREFAELLAQDHLFQFVECSTCKTEYKRQAPAVQVRSLRYPYFNDSLGTVVESRAHEKHVAQKAGFVELGTEPIRVKRPKKKHANRRR